MQNSKFRLKQELKSHFKRPHSMAQKAFLLPLGALGTRASIALWHYPRVRLPYRFAAARRNENNISAFAAMLLT